jgi:dihydroorotate dehydrogenase electron transfer subunit
VQGPLGNGFPLETGCERHILVGGGIGVAPLPGLAEAIIRQTGYAPEVVLAARTEDQLVCVKEFGQMGCPLHLVTDDGSAGMKGFASDGLELLEPDANTVVYACGPMAMMRSLHQVCDMRHAACYASLEAAMACGDGVCMGCVVETTAEEEPQRMARVCKEGPVFNTRTLRWDAEEIPS